ncbi:MAG: hypothetical protein ACKOE7_14240, partial [Actinomycetota bacterium]
MATIILGGQLKPATVRSGTVRSKPVRSRTVPSASRRSAIRDAARTREIRRVYRRRRFGVMALVATVALVA